MKHKNKGLSCGVVNCTRIAWGLGLCKLHYTRLKRSGKTDDPKPRPEATLCSFNGCYKIFYAKGFCKKHYTHNRRYGFPGHKIKSPPVKCSVNECHGIAYAKGLCKFHRSRELNGTELTRPKGTKGPLNVNWKGGVSEYPNHHEMKKARKRVLMRDNYTCQYCGSLAKEVHHKDGSKSNHSDDNLVSCCHPCHMKTKGPYKKTSKFMRLYGMTLDRLAETLGISVWDVRVLHWNGNLSSKINVKHD